MKASLPVEGSLFEDVKVALRQVDGANLRIEHIDIQCDGCGTDPIVGER